MVTTHQTHDTAQIKAEIRALEARLSQEQCELLRQIRAVRAAIGPVTKKVGTLLHELNEMDTLDAD